MREPSRTRESAAVRSTAQPTARERAPAALRDAVRWYRAMIVSRRFEEEAERAFRRGKIGGYLHVYSGQEAVAAGWLAELRADDIFFTAYRDHAHALFRGSSPDAVMAELFGKATGLAKGKGGSMHLFDVGRGFYGGYGIVGGHLPLATGAAYALRYRGTDRACLCFLGDGAINTGAFHEAVNMAGVWGRDGMCPIVYIIENNQYGMGTAVERSSAVTNLAARFGAYDVEHERVDGMDFLAMRAVASRVIAQVRAHGRPYAVEVLTSRFAGHGAADLFQPYRSKDEIAKARGRDPIALLEHQLHEAGLLTEAEAKRIHDEATQTIQNAVRFAEESPEPEPDALFTDIYGAS